MALPTPPAVPSVPSLPNVPPAPKLPGTPPDLSQGFGGAPSALSVCGFAIPLNFPFPSFTIPIDLSFIPNPLPIPRTALALNCSLNNPLSITASVAGPVIPKGGGRLPNALPDPDLNDATP